MIDLKKIKKSEFGYLKGFFIGDGYKHHDIKGRKYYIEFYVNSLRDKKILNFLLSIIKNAGLNPGLYLDKRFNCERLRIINKDFYMYFDKDISKMKIAKKEIIGFISGMIDSDGYVNNKKSFIQIVNTDLRSLNFIQNQLNKKGINSSINNKWKSSTMKTPSFNLYISVKFKRLSHLSIKAGYRMTSA
jgi:hypothetical protein